MIRIKFTPVDSVGCSTFQVFDDISGAYWTDVVRVKPILATGFNPRSREALDPVNFWIQLQGMVGAALSKALSCKDFITLCTIFKEYRKATGKSHRDAWPFNRYGQQPPAFPDICN